MQICRYGGQHHTSNTSDIQELLTSLPNLTVIEFGRRGSCLHLTLREIESIVNSRYNTL
jgi:hypothetical protein